MANGLDIAIEIKAPLSTFTSDTGLFVPAKRRSQIAHEEAVGPDGACVQGGADTLRPLCAAGEKGGRQPVIGGVAHCDGLCFVLKGLEGQNRTKNLALEAFRTDRGVEQKRWFKVESTQLLGDVTTIERLCSIL